MKLRPYQTEAVRQTNDAWARGAKNVLISLPTGAGKTVTFGKLLAEETGGSVVIAHRTELVAQASLALAIYGIRHRVIGPPSVSVQCSQLHLNHPDVGVSYVSPNARCAVAGVDTLIRRSADDGWFRSVKLWVVDECFPAGTIVSGRAIETLKPGDVVDAFNEKTGEMEQRAVVRVFKNNMPKHMMRVVSTHHVLECTNGHPFYTRRGWVEAARLTLEDEVLIHDPLYPMWKPGDGPELQSALRIQKERTDFLPTFLRDGVPIRQSSAACAASHLLGPMLPVRRGSDVEKVPVRLLEGLRKMLLQPDVQQSSHFGVVFSHHGGHQSQVRFGSYENEQPYGRAGSACQDDADNARSRAPTEGTRRQRSGSYESGSFTANVVYLRRLCGATSDKNSSAEGSPLPLGLQARLGAPRAHAGDRSGRGVSYGRSAGTGCEERRVLTWARLDRLEVFERYDTDPGGPGRGDGFVYNIEVEGLHTYVANGVVVHNCHHLLKAPNKWGRAVEMFPNARGLGVTATPARPDGRGLGTNNDGMMDTMVRGPDMRYLIQAGYLTPYRIFAPPSDVNYSNVAVTASGELSTPQLSAAVHASKQFVGDVVDHYLRIAPGKLGITFCVDVASCVEIAAEYRLRGVPAEVINAETPPALRAAIMRRFRAREILQLVNVDILGEGVDVPAVEVVSMARRTASLVVYRQQAGRVLRLLLPVALRGAWDTYTDEQRRRFIAEGQKPFGIIIDHVGNVAMHGLPDSHKDWSLDRREKRGRGDAPNDVEPTRTCLNKDTGRDGSMIPCLFSYSRILGPECPECGFVHVPAKRDGPEYVDGVLVEIDPEVIERMNADVAAVYAPFPEVATFHANPFQPVPGQLAAMKRHYDQHEAGAAEHAARQAAQATLRPVMATWGGWRTHEGDDVATMQRRFYYSFGLDVLSAQALGSDEAATLAGRIRAVLSRENILIDETVNSD